MRSTSHHPSTFIERARRDQIVAGAIQVLALRGYEHASLTGIAAEVGVSKGLVSYHFDGKDDLLREVLRTVLERAGSHMEPRVTAAPSYLEAVRTYVGANLDFLGEHRTEMLAVGEVLTHVRAPDGVTPLYASHGAEAVRQLAALLTLGQQADELGSFSPFVVAVSVRASIDAVTGLMRTQPDLDVASYGAELDALVVRMVSR